MKKSSIYLLGALPFMFFAAGCSDDDPVLDENDDKESSWVYSINVASAQATQGLEVEGGVITAISELENDRYVIAATPLATDGVADYLLTADDLSQGAISLVNSGIEQDGTYRYYVTSDDKFFSLLYGQGNPGAVTAYELGGQGELVKLTDFQSETVQAFAAVDDDILMVKIPRGGDAIASWYQLDTETLQFGNQGQMDVFKVANNGEQAFFTWVTQVGDKVFAPYMSVKSCCNDNFGTNYPDSAWVAVFSYPEMTLETVIKDDRTSYIGRYFNSGLEEVENGDVYAFSSSIATTNDVLTSTKPSAITRIKKGSLEFDESYFFNLETASGGYYMTDKIYAGNGKFVLMMHPVAEKAKYAMGKRFAVVDVFQQTLTWVKGLPDAANIVSIGTNNHVAEDGSLVYVGITTK